MADEGELARLQHGLETACVGRDDRIRENESLTSTVAELKEEVAGLNAQHSDLEHAKDVRQGMLNDISDFGSKVYHQWDLSRD